LSFNNNKTTYKDFFNFLELAFLMFDGFFFELLTPFTLGGHNFLNFIMFLIIFNALEVSIKGIKFCLNTRNNGAFPLDLACLKHFNVVIAIQFAIKEQLKDLTQMFCF